MRTLFAFLLLAGAATPALAADPGDRHGWQSRHESGTQSKSEDRGDRGNSDRPHADRGNRDNNNNNDGARNDTAVERSRPVMRVQSDGGGNDRGRPVMHVESHAGDGGDAPRHVIQVESNNGGNGSDARVRTHRGRFSNGDQSVVVQGDHRRNDDSSDTVRSWRGPKVVRPTDVAVSPTLRQPDHRVPAVFRNRVPIVSDTPREGTQPRLRTDGHRRIETSRWRTNWRSDHRYDWKDWRHRHRSIFHLGFYYDPFGWSYRPYQIGWRLWPSYYSSNFWINDPGQYRLPYAPPGYRWIRYYDDAVLIDTWDGQVVDVIYNFFW